MKIVIEIPDHIYEHAKNISEDSNDEWDAMRAIAKGFLYEERPHGEWEKESAIDYLIEIGWLPEHDRILTERPHGEWEKLTIYESTCSCCKNVIDRQMFVELPNFCPNCGADMRKEGERNDV